MIKMSVIGVCNMHTFTFTRNTRTHTHTHTHTFFLQINYEYTGLWSTFKKSNFRNRYTKVLYLVYAVHYAHNICNNIVLVWSVEQQLIVGIWTKPVRRSFGTLSR